MKKTYQKPDVNYIDFYSKETITDTVGKVREVSYYSDIYLGISGTITPGYNPDILPD